MKNLNYRVIIRKEPEGSYTAIVPTLKGCITWGETIEEAMKMAKELRLVIILKGHFTLIAAPDGKGYFNPTGNPGMATAGSGDVLTGMLTGLLAQGYHSLEAALLAVYLHGLAGDLAAADLSMEAMLAGNISDYIGKAYQQIQSY